MVPNSLGPAELLLHYGTERAEEPLPAAPGEGPRNPVLRAHQPRGRLRRRLDSRLRHRVPAASGRARKCSACASRGTSATSRSGPVATLLGLAFRLYDPEGLIGRREGPRHHLRAGSDATRPGVNIGRRHLPLNAAFQNGPNSGKDVFMPLDWIIGGREYAGKGWRMLDGLPRRRARDLAADLRRRRRQGAGALRRRLRARAQPVQDADRPVRRRRGGARAHRRALLHDGRDARHDRGRGRPRREAGGALGDRQVPHDRARAPVRERRAWTSWAARASASGRTTSSGAATRSRRSPSPSRARTSSRAR